MKHLLPLLSVLIMGSAALAGEPEEATSPAPLPSNVVARIDGTDIPTDWFAHEFRSSFFRHLQEPDVHGAVFDPFLKRMILARRAREAGLDRKPEVQAEIRRRVDGMRAYMEYQLAMAEIGILNQALIEDLGLARASENVTDEELRAFFETTIKGQPGAPTDFEQLPPQARDSIRRQLAMQDVERKLDAMMEEWKKGMTIEVNGDAVRSVPMPDMKGKPPEGLRMPGP